MIVRLAPGADILLRGEHAVQFGLGAAVLPTPYPASAAAVVAALHPARSPIPLQTLHDRLRAAGLDAPTAAAVLGDLLFQRLLIDATPPAHSVVLLGRSPLARAIAGLLREDGIVVRQPLTGEPDRVFVREAGPFHAPVVVADRLSQAVPLAQALARRAATVLPVALIGPGALVGPLRLGGQGPCLMCANLHGTDADPQWFRLVRQLPGGPSLPPTLTVAATAVAVVGILHRVLGRPAAPGTAAPAPPAPGHLLRIAADGAASQPAEVWARHPRCPVCFGELASGSSPARPAATPRSVRP